MDAEEENKQKREALNRSTELWREVIKQRYTAEHWAELKEEERQELKIDGLKLRAIAKIFGIQESPVGLRAIHLKLGRQIYGDDPVIMKAIGVKERTPEQWHKLIKEKIKTMYTAGQWVELKTEERKKVQIENLKLKMLARIFGIQGDSIYNHTNFLELGRQIYEDDPVILKAIEVEERTPEQWREKIKETYTVERWVNLKNRGRSKTKIENLGLSAIARIFGIQGDPNFNRVVYLNTGRQIYGDDPVILKAIEVEERTPEQWREVIKGKYTAEQWIGLQTKEREEMKIDGHKLHSIAGIFGIQGDPTSNRAVHLKLGEKIYENDPVITAAVKEAGETPKRPKRPWHETIKKTRMPEQWREMIKGKYTAEQWANLKNRERLKVKIEDLGLAAIARIFEVS